MYLGKNHKRLLLLIAPHKSRSQLTGIFTCRYHLALPRLLCALGFSIKAVKNEAVFDVTSTFLQHTFMGKLCLN